MKCFVDACLSQKAGKQITALEGKSQWQKIQGWQGTDLLFMKFQERLMMSLCNGFAKQQFHNPNDAREVLFCCCFSYMLKSQSSVGLQQRKKVHPRG